MSAYGQPPQDGRLGWASIAAVMLLATSVAAVVASLITARASGPDDPSTAIVQGVAALMLVSVGGVLLTRLPRHLVGWLLAIGGTMIAISSGATGVADYGLNIHPGSVPAAIWVGWLAQSIWAPELACLFILLPLFYPTGRLPSPRWRAVLVIAIALAVIGGVSSGLEPWALDSWALDSYPVANPLAMTGSAGDLMLFLSNVVGTGLLLVGATLAVASLLIRYRQATMIERQQIKWFALVAVVTSIGGIVSITANTSTTGAAPAGLLGLVNAIAGFVIYGGLALLPLAIGIAVLRYRLYEIDRLISRTIAYGLLTLLLGTSSWPSSSPSRPWSRHSRAPTSSPWPAPPSSSRPSSSPSAGRSSDSSTGASTAPATTPSGRSPPWPPACATRSISTPCGPTCWPPWTPPSSRPAPVCGCGDERRPAT